MTPSRHVPKYAMVEEFLTNQIESGRYQAGDQLPTEDELVTLLGVSKGPIRQAVMQLVQSGLLHKVQGRGTFVREHQKRESESAEDCICTLMPAFGQYGHFYLEELLRGVDNAALDLGKRADIIYLRPRANATPSPERLRTVMRQISRSRGVIALGSLSLQEVQGILETGVPFVSIHTDYEQFGLQVDHVSRPYASYCALAARYLAERGHRRLLYLDYRDRGQPSQDAFTQAAQQAGATVDIIGEGNPYRLLTELRAKLKGNPVPTAVFASRTELSQIILEMVQARELRIPDDVAVLGYADTVLSGNLTQLIPPLSATSRAAVRLLLGLDSEAPELQPEFLDKGTVPHLTDAT